MKADHDSIKMISSLTPVTQHITETDSNGVSHFRPSPSDPLTQDSGIFKAVYIYSTPPSFTLEGDADLKHYDGVLASAPIQTPMFSPAGGSALFTLDILPNTVTDGLGMHRTKTIDYLFVMEGEVELVLEGETRVVKKGDVIVQRGTWHAWRNKTDRVARFGVVVLGAEGAVEGGVEVK